MRTRRMTCHVDAAIQRMSDEEFDGWCTANGRTSLPATPETVAAYFDDLPEVARVGSLIPEMYAAAISRNHICQGLPDPIYSPEVTQAIRDTTALEEQRGRRVNPITLRCLNLIEEHAQNPRTTRGQGTESQEQATQRALEDSAIIRITREADACGSDLEELRWHDIEQTPDGTALVTLGPVDSSFHLTHKVSTQTAAVLRELADTTARDRETVLGIPRKTFNRRIKSACTQAGLGNIYSLTGAKMGMFTDLVISGIRGMRRTGERTDYNLHKEEWQEQVRRFNLTLSHHPGEFLEIMRLASAGIA